MEMITLQYLREHPDHIFVFGDNQLRKGKKGAATLRDEPNSYGFITKKYPSYKDGAFYRPNGYREVFKAEMELLIHEIKSNPDKLFLISKLGSGLADRYKIWHNVIKEGLLILEKFPNVKFLF